MTMLFMSGQDFMATTAENDTFWENYTHSVSTDGAVSGNAVSITTNTNIATIIIAARSTVFVECMIRSADMLGSADFSPYITFVYEGTDQFELKYSEPLERFAAYLGSTKHEEATKRTPLHKGWHHLAVKCLCGSFGAYEVRWDGVVILSDTDIDTDQANSSFINRIDIEGVAGPTFYDSIRIFDNLGTLNNNFLGMKHIYRTSPDSAGDNTEWTPSSGSNWATVDDATPSGGTDYVAAGTDGAKDYYGMTNLTGIADIAAVQVNAYCTDFDGNGDGLILRMKSGSTEAAGPKGPQVAPQGTYGYRWDIFETDPNTSAAWNSFTELNAAQVGAESDI